MAFGVSDNCACREIADNVVCAVELNTDCVVAFNCRNFNLITVCVDERKLIVARGKSDNFVARFCKCKAADYVVFNHEVTRATVFVGFIIAVSDRAAGFADEEVGFVGRVVDGSAGSNSDLRFAVSIFISECAVVDRDVTGLVAVDVNKTNAFAIAGGYCAFNDQFVAGAEAFDAVYALNIAFAVEDNLERCLAFQISLRGFADGEV